MKGNAMKRCKPLYGTGAMCAGILLGSSITIPIHGQIVGERSPDKTIVLSEPVALPPPQARVVAVDPALLAVEIRTPSQAEIRNRLKQSAVDHYTKAQARKAKLWQSAGQLGLPLQLHGLDGYVNRLVDITPEGHAIYLQSHNVAAADTVGMDNLWAPESVDLWDDTGGSSLELSGANQTVGLWDVSGSVLTTHEQFSGTRVLQLDDTSGTAQHATMIAGALASSGITRIVSELGNFNIGNHSRGAAFAATVHAYDTENIIDERSGEAAGNLQLSVHPYGIQSGWVSQDGYWFWHGCGAFEEDPKFGAYLGGDSGITPRELDVFAQSAPNSLLIYSAGNDRTNGPGIPETYYLPNDPDRLNPQIDTRDWENGDEGGYDSLNPSACAKNILTVGGVQDIPHGYLAPSDVQIAPLSSFGPTDDGRIKPDVVAAASRTGEGDRNPFGWTGFFTPDYTGNNAYVIDPTTATGTSFAAATVGGALAAVLELRQTLLPVWGAPDFEWPLLSSTLRALAIHNAQEAGGAAGPDFKFGYGLFDAVKTANLVQADSEAEFTPYGGHPKPYIKEVLLTNGAYIQFRARIPSSPGEPLKVTICWNDPAGPAQSLDAVDPTNKRLVNDVDLRIFPPGTTDFNESVANKPYTLDPLNPAGSAGQSDDSINNVEQVVVENPTGGADYIVRVTHKVTLEGNENQQWVSIIISGAEIIPAPDLVLSITSAGGNSVNLSWPAVVGGIYQIRGSASLFGPWTDSTGEISANLENITVKLDAPTSPYFWRAVRHY